MITGLLLLNILFYRFAPNEVSKTNCDNELTKSGVNCIKIPANAKLSEDGKSWECNTGHIKENGSCKKLNIPPHGRINKYGFDWECEEGYFRVGPKCKKIRIPKNAHFNETGKEWRCNQGYHPYRGKCRKD